MFLTKTSSSTPRDPRQFPAIQLTLLVTKVTKPKVQIATALVRLAEPIALTSIYPYAWKLVLNLKIAHSNDASFYAGLLIAAFSLAESFTGVIWGTISDKVGRKPILLFGCTGTMLSLLLLGFSTNFWMALAARALGGLLNGNVGVIQTMVGELVTMPEHEAKAFAIMPFVWSIGTIIGPALGGCLAQPSMNYPSVFPSDGLFAKFPFLLPNLVCAIILLIAILAGAFAIEETHPDMQPWSTLADLDRTAAETPLMATAGATEHAPADLKHQSYGTFNSVNVEEEKKWRVKSDGRPSSVSSTTSTKVYSRRIVMTIVALGIFTYHSMTYDTLLPIYLQDKRSGDFHELSASQSLAGGLGLTTQQVGIIMAFNGIIALFIQGVLFPFMAARLGIWRLFLLVTFGHPISYFIVPFLALLPLKIVVPGIYFCLCIRNFFSILAYPVLLILIKEASPGPSYLGKINGLAASTGAGCRTIASPVAGWLYGLGTSLNFTPLAWWSSAIVAIFGACQVFFMRRYRERTSVRTLVHHISTETLNNPGATQVVHIKVQDTIFEEGEYSDEEQSLL